MECTDVTNGDTLEGAEARALAAIGHELKSPLQVLTNLLYLIGNDGISDSGREWLARAQAEVARIREITSSLLDASRQPAFESDVDVATVLDDSLHSFQEKIEFKKVTVERRFECRGVIKSAQVEVRQVFDNIIANALEAVPIRGKIVVHLIESSDWRKTSRTGCRVVVFDDGPGIPQEFMDKIFDLFFTTKVEKGTGIGLWVVQRIVRRRHGSIRVRSRIAGPTRGTAFSIFLPTAADRTDYAVAS